MSKPKKGRITRKSVVHICGPSRDYYYGDPRPPKAVGYFDFVEWQAAQLRKRRRPRTSAR